MALQMAYEKYDFTHYDLHLNNIMIRYPNRTFSIVYIMNNKQYLIETKGIATIIDFGTSHIKYNDKHYALNESDVKGYSYLPDHSFPLHDLYMLIGEAYVYINKEFPQLFDYFLPFKKPEINKELYPIYPHIPELLQFSYYDFFVYIDEQFPNRVKLINNLYRSIEVPTFFKEPSSLEDLDRIDSYLISIKEKFDTSREVEKISENMDVFLKKFRYFTSESSQMEPLILEPHLFNIFYELESLRRKCKLVEKYTDFNDKQWKKELDDAHESLMKFIGRMNKENIFSDSFKEWLDRI